MARDYAKSGLDIQYAINDHYEQYPDKDTRPDHIVWNGLQVTTADAIQVPKDGLVRAEFLSHASDPNQGFDIELDGWIELAQGERVKRLRTWDDPRYARTVEYTYYSKDGVLWVWNVYKRLYPKNDLREEKWTGNAGMWIERISSVERIYHCSPGTADSPDFESFLFKISIIPRAEEMKKKRKA